MNRILRKLRALMREMHALRAKRGPYRFLVRKWDSISDLNLALRVLETEIFSQELDPVPLPLNSLKSILVLAPHQDDEAIGAGGSLLLASAAGVKIDIVFVTDGTAKQSPYASSPADAARVRQQEAKEVCSKIGATMHQLSISNQSPKPSVEDLDRLSEIIREVKPQIVMAPWLLDSPAKHRLVNHLLWLANRRSALPFFEVWGYQVHNTLFPNGYVDITPVAEQKRELLKCYYSQNEFSKRYDHLAMGMSAWNSRFLKGAEAKYIEVFFALPVNELLRLVEKFYFSDLAATYRGHSAVLAGAQEIHRAVVNGSNFKQREPLWERKNKEITS
jgi:LmbE family N-acetylglucosaminyl deacetylase